ncbi:hypothetical protein SPHINGO391_380051 [Sphingomonas aurantiaca]|uniref:Uncharacterized protein n=1 Tax=Sphingomonas aurantiaca TaxID=185949 RepID=A0A5E7YPE2_9SPHN|nr:hypothetical protein SPHINGO391_380051 [Sphingomonas aurantiaca]
MRCVPSPCPYACHTPGERCRVPIKCEFAGHPTALERKAGAFDPLNLIRLIPAEGGSGRYRTAALLRYL